MNLEFLNLLAIDLDGTTQLLEPQEDVQEGEEVVGEISQELRKLYTYWRQTGQRAGEYENQMKWTGRTDDLARLQHETAGKTAALFQLLWVGINDELHLWGDTQQLLALRKGWKIVRMPRGRWQIYNLGGGPFG